MTKKVKPIIKYVIILFLSSIFFVSFIFFKEYFKINTFEIEGYKSTKLNGLDALLGQNLIFLNKKEASEILIKANAEVKNVIIEKSYPNKLKIDVRRSDPLAIFKVDGGFLILNDTARITAKKRKIDADLPIIQYYQKLSFVTSQIGDKLDYKDIKFTLELIKVFLNLGINPVSIDIKDTNVITFNLVEKQILFTTEKDLGRQQAEFEAIIKQFKIQGKNYKVLDLRFEKPIVKF